MYKKIIFPFFISILLTSCISVAVDSNSGTAVGPDFVTATLAPTKQSFVPATLTPTPEIIITPTIAVTAPPNCKEIYQDLGISKYRHVPMDQVHADLCRR
jgi:hypothetical protein